MKKIICTCLCSMSLFFTISFTSCEDYLDVDKYFNDMLNIDTVFTKKNYTEQWLTNVYSKLNSTNRDGAVAVDMGKGSIRFNFASDDLIFGDWGESCQKYQNCEYTASTQLSEDRWGRVYEGIRDASTFIHNVDKCKQMTMSERADNKGQARFLRAYFYWVLIRQYGPVPIMPDEGVSVSSSYEELAVPRNTYDECVDFINQELVEAARSIPPKRAANNIARATRGSALALRAKVLLYAASPLYNGNADMFSLKNKAGIPLISQEYSEEKWAKAAAAAKEVINLGEYELLTVQISDKTVTPPLHSEYSTKGFPNGWSDIDPFESYRQIFNGNLTASKNPELIFMRVHGANELDELVRHAVPRTLSGWNTVAVTQKQVDAYSMRNGQDIEHSSEYVKEGFTLSSNEYDYVGADVSKMYVNREPRFYASIAYNGSIWENASTTKGELINNQIFYYKGSKDGKLLSSPEFYLRTGIGLKKFYHPEDSWTEGGSRLIKTEPSIRYADVLLWYAEAVNELTQSHTLQTFNEMEITVKRDVEEMRSAMKPVRMRAGIPDLANAVYQNKEQFRNALVRERQIEFLGESSRYFDLRRWLIAEREEAIPIMGCNVDMGGTANQRQLYYLPAIATNMPKVFLSKMYLWPLSNNELRRNPNLVQNPGW